MQNPKKMSRWLIFLCVFLLGVMAFSQAVMAGDPKVLDPSYKFTRIAKDTLFAGPNGAVIGLDGALYTVHTGSGQISRIDLKTMKVTQFVRPFTETYITDDIAIDDKGNFFVTGTTPIIGEVYRVDKNGLKTVIASGLIAPNGIRYNFRTGRLFTSECFQANRVFEIDPAGVKEPRLIVKENVIAVPEGFDIDPATEDLIIPDMGTGKILRVNPDSGEIKTIAEGFAAPIALKIGSDNNIYFPELGGAVYRLSMDGQKREKLATLPAGLDNLAITKEGRLFVTNYWNATIHEVSTDGSGKFKTLFPTGPNALDSIIVKNNKILVCDAIRIHSVEKGKYVPTKINAWAAHGMPLPLGLADGPADSIFWTDAVNNAVAMGNPFTGTFKAIAGKLDRPMAAVKSMTDAKLYVAEFGAGQITVLGLNDGSKSVLTKGLDGPIAMAIINDNLYVAEAKATRISKVSMSTGKTEVFLSGIVGKVGALANDGMGQLLALDGASGRLFRINPLNLKISVVAERLPVSYSIMGGTGLPVLEWPLGMSVDGKGSIYITTNSQGVIALEKKK